MVGRSRRRGRRPAPRRARTGARARDALGPVGVRPLPLRLAAHHPPCAIELRSSATYTPPEGSGPASRPPAAHGIGRSRSRRRARRRSAPRRGAPVTGSIGSVVVCVQRRRPDDVPRDERERPGGVGRLARGRRACRTASRRKSPAPSPVTAYSRAPSGEIATTERPRAGWPRQGELARGGVAREGQQPAALARADVDAAPVARRGRSPRVPDTGAGASRSVCTWVSRPVAGSRAKAQVRALRPRRRERPSGATAIESPPASRSEIIVSPPLAGVARNVSVAGPSRRRWPRRARSRSGRPTSCAPADAGSASSRTTTADDRPPHARGDRALLR